MGEERAHDRAFVFDADHPAVLVGQDHGPTPVDACASLDVLGQAQDLLGRHDQAANAFGRWAALADEAGLVTSKLHALVSLGGHQLLCGLPASALWEARALQTKSYLRP